MGNDGVAAMVMLQHGFSTGMVATLAKGDHGRRP